MTPKKKRGTWSYFAGKRQTATEPSSRVRVYERKDAPGIYMTCAWDQAASGRLREIRLPAGINRDAAEALADMTASKWRARVLAGRDSFGMKKAVTLGELIERYHSSSDASEWSERHKGDMERARDFWKLELGESTEVEALTRETVEGKAKAARNRSEWGARKERKLLAYIRQLTRWGCDKARLYDAYPLRGLTMPQYEPEVEELFYSTEETALLLGGVPGADWRDVLAVHIAADTGRRVTAILSLTTGDILADHEEIYLRFRKDFDKGGRSALVPISVRTAELLATALEQKEVTESGFLFPEGRLDYKDPRNKPRERGTAIKGLHRLEEMAGVKRLKGRGFHGLKRSHVTASMEESSGDTALVGDITGNLSAELLRRVYRRANRGRSRKQVERVRMRLEGREDK